jgi:mRNA interferase RelE/StbE
VTFPVRITHEAEKILDRLDRPTEKRIRERLAHLADDPFDPRLSTPLTDRRGIRKSRIGGWRVLFTVNRDTSRIYVITVDTRGQVYKH